MTLRTPFLLVRLLAFFLAGCQLSPAPMPSAIPLPTLTANLPAGPVISTVEDATMTPDPRPTLTETLIPKASLPFSFTPGLSATPLPSSLFLDPENWQQWPVIPTVTEYIRQVFLLGQSLGNDPHAFSVLGDCQSESEFFMGIYETDPQEVAALPVFLQETVVWFTGSFNRKSPTVHGGTTTGALIWAPWHQNKYTCTSFETPLGCELRIHDPSFVIIHVGTHYENRNEEYMRTILDQLLAAGVVPILASKADNRELDKHINTQYARLALEYNIPFWNFWAALESLPNRGLYTRADARYQGDLYLNDEAAAIHRLTALQALDVVRRAVMTP
jgi:hypothetical protein